MPFETNVDDLLGKQEQLGYGDDDQQQIDGSSSIRVNGRRSSFVLGNQQDESATSLNIAYRSTVEPHNPLPQARRSSTSTSSKAEIDKTSTGTQLA